MATIDEISALRRAIAEPTNAEPYTDAYLSALIDVEGSTDKAAASVWTAKAASAASLVDMSESGSSRRLSQLQSNYLAMAARFREGDTEPATGGTSYVVGIERT
jgi:hypothetical protein